MKTLMPFLILTIFISLNNLGFAGDTPVCCEPSEFGGSCVSWSDGSGGCN